MPLLPFISLVLATVAPFSTRIGLALSVPDGAGEEEFMAAIRQQIRLGLDGAAPSLKWDENEEQNGKPLNDSLGVLKLMGQEGLLTINTLDTIKRRLPKDLMDKSWDDPVLTERWEKFLAEITPKLGKRVLWVSLGNEVDGYLNSRPGEVAGYKRFLARGRAIIRKIRPDIGVGVTVMCLESQKSPNLASLLQENTDVCIFTYYPSGAGPTANNPSIWASQFDFMLGIAGNRPLLLQEIGYPASEKAGSSPEKQAEFIGEVFRQLDRHTARIPLAAFFMQSDFPASLMHVLESYYGISDPGFLAFLGSLGLKDAKGQPRPAWKVFEEAVRKRKG
ncbi:MAG: hypothetical protein HZC36_06160 [Armatimonadetes bacterium]|nr:hypothetical protein [Armatimonadota bacterium]